MSLPGPKFGVHGRGSDEVRMCMCACLDAHVLNVTLYVCMSGEEAGVGEWGRECESETKIIFDVFVYFIRSFLSSCVSIFLLLFLCFLY